jgi:hypothetical protein
MAVKDVTGDKAGGIGIMALHGGLTAGIDMIRRIHEVALLLAATTLFDHFDVGVLRHCCRQALRSSGLHEPLELAALYRTQLRLTFLISHARDIENTDEIR